MQDGSGSVALLSVDLKAGACRQSHPSCRLTLIVADRPLGAVVETPRLRLGAVAGMQLEVGQLLAAKRLPAQAPLRVLREVDLAEDIGSALSVVPLHCILSSALKRGAVYSWKGARATRSGASRQNDSVCPREIVL